MRAELQELLETFGYPVRLQGSFATTEAYPESFFTIWNNETTDWDHFDNNTIGYVWDFSVYFFSTSPSNVINTTRSAINLLKANGWIIDGLGSDAASDEVTHTGRTFDCTFIEHPVEEEDPTDPDDPTPGNDDQTDDTI